jgi:hypothetical protein
MIRADVFIRRGMLSWAELRSLGNSRVVQASAMFPFVGYLILFNDQLNSFFVTAGLDNAPPSVDWVAWLWSRKLYFLYFGLMALGIGSFVYTWKCPPFVKKHGDFADYIRIDGPSLSTSAVLEIGESFGFPKDDVLKDVSKYKPDILRFWYADRSNAHRVARDLTTVLFGVGLFLLAIPSAISAFKIAALFLR